MNKEFGIKNFSYSLFAQIITIAFGIIVPRLILVNLGSEANGLLSTASNTLIYLSLLEAGVGTATLNALYVPIVNGDKKSINHILSATHHFYLRTGKVYLALVVVVSAILSFSIETSIPRLSVFFVILLAGLSGVINYFFQGKFNIFLAAEGKNYVITNITTFVGVCTNVLKIVLLLCGYDVIAIQLMYFCVTLLQMSLTLIYVKKHYKWIDLSVEPNFEAISQRKAVLVHQVSGLVFSNTDVIILSIMADLKQVSVYSMYILIFGMIKSIALAASGSFVYALGQSFGDRDRFVRIFDTYEVYSMAFSSALFCIGGIIITPFLKLYTAGVNDVNYIDKWLPYLFMIYFCLHFGRQSSSHLIDIAQKFEETKWRSIFESCINVVSSIILTYFLGIYGVVLGTIIALLYRTNDMIIYASKLINRSCWITYRRWLTNLMLVVLFTFIASRITVELSDYVKLCIFGIIISIVVIPTFMVVNSIQEQDSARYAIRYLKELVEQWDR